MVKCQRIIETPCAHEPANQDHDIDDNSEDHPRNNKGIDADLQSFWQASMNAGVALAGDCCKVFSGQPKTLDEEG
ncbi:hypothetical protein D3C80_1571400 [compost metagenome]